MGDRTLPLLQWLATQRPAPRVGVLICGHARTPRVAPDAVAVQVTGCLTAEELVLPAQLLASGLAALEVVACEVCPGEVREQVAGWSRVLDGITLVPPSPRASSLRRSGPAYRMAVSGPGTGPALSRRMLIGLGRQRPTGLDLSADEPARGLQALRLLQAEGRARVGRSSRPARAGPPLAVQLQAAGCVACGVCVAACAHQALEIADDAGSAVLRHRADLCRADQACVRLCPSAALSVTGVLSVLDLVEVAPGEGGTIELARLEVARCRRCGARHPATEGRLCPPCAFRAEHAFGSALHPCAPT